VKKSIWTSGMALALCASAFAAPAEKPVVLGGTPSISVADTSVTEALGVLMVFPLTLSEPAAQDVTVAYATADGTATAGFDYVAASGTVTFLPGSTTAEVRVQIAVDSIDETDETFALNLSNPVGAVLGDGQAIATILDGNPPPDIAAGDCEKLESGGMSFCQVPVYLLGPTTLPVTVDYATSDGTAAAGLDYEPTSGTLTFSASPSQQSVALTILGDAANELDEVFYLVLSNPTNATLQDPIGDVTILNDDGPDLAGQELTHGALVRADLAAAGPLANPDFYRVPQGPYTSWEVVADEVSGDIAPGLVLERLAENKVTVLQTGTVVGMGSAQALRWQRRAATADVRPFIRVRSTGCTTGCGPDDVYRIRAYETTATIPRFNNSATQATIVVLQNTTDAPIATNLDFWSTGGSHLAAAPLTLAPRGLGVVSGPSIPALVGQSGSITITSDGPYGALAGKAVALEPATGFSFDSPLAYKQN
jgi:hypothetical protein